jgi:hypothetical protein
MKGVSMSEETMEKLIKKQLKWYRTELAMLSVLVVLGIILILSGIGVYFYVSKLTIAQELSMTSAKNFIVAQIKMLYDFSRALGAVFSLTGLAVIILALNRLFFIRDIHKIGSSTREKKS